MTEVRVTVTEPSDLCLWPRQQVSRSSRVWTCSSGKKKKGNELLIYTIWINLTIITLSDRRQNPPQIAHAMIPFRQNYKKCKHYTVTADHGCLTAAVGKGRAKRIQRGLRNLPWTSIYSPCVGMVSQTYICQKSSAVNFKYVQFIICQFYLNASAFFQTRDPRATNTFRCHLGSLHF